MGRILQWGTVHVSRKEVGAACEFFASDPYSKECVRRDAESYMGEWFFVELPARDAAKLAAFLGRGFVVRDVRTGN